MEGVSQEIRRLVWAGLWLGATLSVWRDPELARNHTGSKKTQLVNLLLEPQFPQLYTGSTRQVSVEAARITDYALIHKGSRGVESGLDHFTERKAEAQRGDGVHPRSYSKKWNGNPGLRLHGLSSAPPWLRHSTALGIPWLVLNREQLSLLL
jgi:hypothetical protein